MQWILLNHDHTRHYLQLQKPVNIVQVYKNKQSEETEN